MFDLDQYLAADDKERRAMMQTTTPREFTNAIANETPARRRELLVAAMSAVAPMIGASVAKPTALPEWATDETNNTEPTLGTKQAGWGNGDTADSSWMNWWMNLVYQWVAWLDAGVLEGVSLDLSGDLTSGGDVEADNLYFTSTETKLLDIHGTNYGSFGTTASGYKQSTGALQVHDVAIGLPLGAMIFGYSFRLKRNSSADVTHKLVKITDGVETDVGATTISAPGATWQTVFKNFTPETVILNTRYVVRFTASASGIQVGSPAVDWIRPKP